MAYQNITQYTSPNQSSRGGARITSITIHHWGARGQKFQNVVNYLCKKRYDANGRDVSTSAHYVAEAGRVACIVAPGRRAWHAGNNVGNDTSIGIECRPEATGGDYATVAELVRNLRAVYGDLPLKRHSDWKNTACPGAWDLARIDRLARSARPVSNPVSGGGNVTAPDIPGAPAPIEKKRKVDDPMIYRAGGERTPFGVYAHNGGWVELSTKAEYDNLLKAGVPQVWVERNTLDNLIADSRAAGK